MKYYREGGGVVHCQQAILSADNNTSETYHASGVNLRGELHEVIFGPKGGI